MGGGGGERDAELLGLPVVPPARLLGLAVGVH